MLESSGEITPPCGVPAIVAATLPVFHHACRKPLPQQLQHPTIRDPPRHQPEQLPVVDAAKVVADIRVQHVVPASRAHARAASPVPAWRSASAGSHTSTARKSASKIGSNTSVAAICATRSRTVGIPNGRCRPSAFGMYRRRTGGGRYVPARSRDAELVDQGLHARRCSTPASVIAIDPRRAAVRASPAAMPPTGRHACRCGPAVHGSGGSGCCLAAAPQSTLQLAHFVHRTRVPRGVVGSGLPVMPSRVLAPSTLPPQEPFAPRRVVRRAARHYYGPLGLPLRRARFRRWLIRNAPPRPGLRRRASRVPFRLPVRVLRPLPRRDLPACVSGLRRSQTWPSP